MLAGGLGRNLKRTIYGEGAICREGALYGAGAVYEEEAKWEGAKLKDGEDGTKHRLLLNFSLGTFLNEKRGS